MTVAAPVVLSLAAVGCNLDWLTDLEVANDNEPDRERVLSQASDVEMLIGGSFFVWFYGTEATSNPAMGLATLADEMTSSYGNGAMFQLSQEPREPWPNEPTFNNSAFTEHPWETHYEALASIRDALQALDSDTTGVMAREIDVPRARAFAKFVQGLSTGFLGLMFDSAFVLDETVDIDTDATGRVPYPVIVDTALKFLDQAITIAADTNWSLDGSWIRDRSLPAAEFIQVVSSYKARFMAQVARTPAERAAVDWPAVIAAVDAGVSEDFTIGTDGSNWRHIMQERGSDWRWFRSDYKVLGYTETSGTYQAWLEAPVVTRDQFVLLTPDKRIAGDATDGTLAGIDFRYEPSSFLAGRGNYHQSSYLHTRYQGLSVSGPLTLISVAAQQLLKAEGLYRLGQLDAAAAIVNVTRVARGGLPPASGDDLDLLDKIIYEHLIENMNVCAGCAYFNKRGWGELSDTRGTPLGTHHWGLVEGSPLHFPMPGAQLAVLRQRLYTYGGVGNEGQGLALSTSSPAALRAAMVFRSPLILLPTLRAKVEYLRAKLAGFPKP